MPASKFVPQDDPEAVSPTSSDSSGSGSSSGSSSPPSTTPQTAANSSPPSPNSVPIPPKILAGWTHRGTPSPHRVAKPTRLGAIDEDTGNVAPDIPHRNNHRPIARVLNFGFAPTLYASRHPPAYSEYSDVKGPNGEYLSDVRRNRAQPRRGGWCRLVFFALIPITIIVALGVGLGIGLTRKHSNNSSSNPSSNTTTPPLVFPEGSYSFTTFLGDAATSCTPNPATWRCYPYETYNESTTGSLTVFNWIISNTSSDDTGPYSISSSNNPFALTFATAPLTLINKNMIDEAYTFSVPMQKVVVPAVSLTADDSTVNCFYNHTTFEGTLYTKRAKTYPPGAQSSSSSNGPIQFGEWPYAVEANEIIKSGAGVPDCYKTHNGVLGEKVDVGTVDNPGHWLALVLGMVLRGKDLKERHDREVTAVLTRNGNGITTRCNKHPTAVGAGDAILYGTSPKLRSGIATSLRDMRLNTAEEQENDLTTPLMGV